MCNPDRPKREDIHVIEDIQLKVLVDGRSTSIMTMRLAKKVAYAVDKVMGVSLASLRVVEVPSMMVSQRCYFSYRYDAPPGKHRCWGVAEKNSKRGLRRSDVVLKGIYHVGGHTYQPELQFDPKYSEVQEPKEFLPPSYNMAGCADS